MRAGHRGQQTLNITMKSRFTTTMYDGTDAEGNTVRKPDLGGIEDTNNYTLTGDNTDSSGVLVAVTGTPTELDTVRGATATTEQTDADAQAWRQNRGLAPGVENSDIPDVEVDDMLNQFAHSDVLSTYEEDKVRVIQNFTQDLTGDERRTVFNRHGVGSVEELLYQLGETEVRDFVTEWGISAIPSHLDTATVARSVIQNQTVGFRRLQDQEMTAINKAAKAKGLERADELTPNTRADMSGQMSDRAKRMLSGHHSDHADMVDYLKGNSTPPWANDANPPAKGSP